MDSINIICIDDMTIYMDSGWMARFWVDIPSGSPMGDLDPAPGGFFPTEQGAGGVEVHMESFPSQALRWRVGVSHQLSKLHSAQAILAQWMVSGTLFSGKPLGIFGRSICLFHRFWHCWHILAQPLFHRFVFFLFCHQWKLFSLHASWRIIFFVTCILYVFVRICNPPIFFLN